MATGTLPARYQSFLQVAIRFLRKPDEQLFEANEIDAADASVHLGEHENAKFYRSAARSICPRNKNLR